MRHASKTLRLTLGWALAALAAAAVYLSWGALYDLAVHVGGMTADRAILFPVVVDLVTVVAMLIALLVPAPRWGIRLLPWATLTVFGAVTIAGNAAHVAVVDARTLALGEAIAVGVNAVPAIALLMVTHLAAATVYRRDDTPSRARAPRASRPPVSEDTTGTPAKRPANRATRDAMRGEVLRLRTEERLSIRDIAARVDVSPSTVGRWVNDPANQEEAA
ncbi:helix-turn-helix domain-containing protein [Agromyces sp. SYSU T00194]|uniref:helix-turn-helix domain-containing protein n=1 Tax=Agromyces chitinivorans TaxID=3158560 RepID=UPI00339438D8